jgi:orotate phosphoribosyltransferase
MGKTKGAAWVEQQLNRFNAVITKSHLVLTSGKHSDGYINLRVLAGHTDVLREIGASIAEAITGRESELATTLSDIDIAKPVVIVGPETLGRTLAEFTAIAGSFGYFAWCDMKKDVDGDFAEWNPKLDFPEIINGSICYIVDDLLTTAKSVKLVKQLIEETGGKVEGVVVVVRRDQEVTAEVAGVPWLYPLLDVSGFNIYEADSCPLCAAKKPMKLRPGHGYEWIKDHEDYPVEGQDVEIQ